MSRKIFIREQVRNGVVLYSPFIQVKWFFGLLTDYEIVRRNVMTPSSARVYYSRERQRDIKIYPEFYENQSDAIKAAEEYLKENP